MSRQTDRFAARLEAQIQISAVKTAARRDARRALLERQSRREKAGFYSDRGVAQDISPSRSRVTSRMVKKGQAFGRIIREVDGMALHATKGWRKA